MFYWDRLSQNICWHALHLLRCSVLKMAQIWTLYVLKAMWYLIQEKIHILLCVYWHYDRILILNWSYYENTFTVLLIDYPSCLLYDIIIDTRRLFAFIKRININVMLCKYYIDIYYSLYDEHCSNLITFKSKTYCRPLFKSYLLHICKNDQIPTFGFCRGYNFA